MIEPLKLIEMFLSKLLRGQRSTRPHIRVDCGLCVKEAGARQGKWFLLDAATTFYYNPH